MHPPSKDHQLGLVLQDPFGKSAVVFGSGLLDLERVLLSRDLEAILDEVKVGGRNTCLLCSCGGIGCLSVHGNSHDLSGDAPAVTRIDQSL